MSRSSVPGSGSAVRLTQQQQLVLDACLLGHNVMIAGSAGSGKSTLLRFVVEKLRGIARCVHVTASTGLAACNLDIEGATTFHAFLAAGQGSQSVPAFISMYERQGEESRGARNLAECDTLVIDEVSMLDPALFQKFDRIAQIVRSSQAPFGGMQVIMSGDWAQLPPIVVAPRNEPAKPDVFVFQTDAWADADVRVFVLDAIFRQNSDPAFIDLLQSVRYGRLTAEHERLLAARVGASIAVPNVVPIELNARRKQVQLINDARMHALPGDVHRFPVKTTYHGTCDARTGAAIARKLIDSLPLDAVLELKVGCAVILTANLSFGGKLVNGTQGMRPSGMPASAGSSSLFSACSPLDARIDAGIVSDFDEEGAPVILFGERRLAMSFYTWAQSTDDPAGSIPPAGVRSRVREFNGVKVHQIPLIKAFAITIHKSQGMTLAAVRMSLGRDVFANGQAYVALSRATTLAGLTLTRFDPAAVKISPHVVEFYEGYQSGQPPLHLFRTFKPPPESGCDAKRKRGALVREPVQAVQPAGPGTEDETAGDDPPRASRQRSG